MNTETLVTTESAYRTERAARRSTRRDVDLLPRTRVRALWRPWHVGAMIAAAWRAGSADDAVRDALAAVDVKTDWHAGRA